MLSCLCNTCLISAEKIVIDVEGFYLKSLGFILKEVSVCSENINDTVLFKSPYDLNLLTRAEKYSISWLTCNLHGLSWEEGQYSYSDRFNIFQSFVLRYPDAKFFTKGAEKCAIIQSLLPNHSIFNLEDLNCPKVCDLLLNDKTIYCPYHKTAKYKRCHCARQKAHSYFRWLKQRNAKTLESITQTSDVPVGKLTNLRVG